MARIYGSRMLEPTKDELRIDIWKKQQLITELKSQLGIERLRHKVTERKLEIATRKVGELVINGELEREFAQSESEPPPEPEIKRRKLLA